MPSTLGPVSIDCPLCGETITCATSIRIGLHAVDSAIPLIVDCDTEPIAEHAAKHRGPDGDGGEPLPIERVA